MTRKSLLTQSLEGNTNDKVKALLKNDTRFVQRRIEEIQHEIEDLEIVLEARLSDKFELDKSTVEVHFANILEKRKQLELYKMFKSAYLNDGDEDLSSISTETKQLNS